jgi:hypothetical protein
VLSFIKQRYLEKTTDLKNSITNSTTLSLIRQESDSYTLQGIGLGCLMPLTIIFQIRVRVVVFNTTFNNISDRVRVMVFNATFNNISVLLWRSVLLVEGSDRHKLHNLMEINLLCIHFYSLKLIFHQSTKNLSQ